MVGWIVIERERGGKSDQNILKLVILINFFSSFLSLLSFRTYRYRGLDSQILVISLKLHLFQYFSFYLMKQADIESD